MLSSGEILVPREDATLYEIGHRRCPAQTFSVLLYPYIYRPDEALFIRAHTSRYTPSYLPQGADGGMAVPGLRVEPVAGVDDVAGMISRGKVWMGMNSCVICHLSALSDC